MVGILNFVNLYTVLIWQLENIVSTPVVTCYNASYTLGLGKPTADSKFTWV